MKTILLAIALFTSLLLSAQVKKGALFIGGDLSVNGYKNTSSDSTQSFYQNNSYSFSPSLGWAVKDNMIVGGRLYASFGNSKQQPSTSPTNKSNSFGAGIWMRKYMPLGKSFSFFAETSLNGNSIYNKQALNYQPNYSYIEKGFSVNAIVYPGVAYQIKKCLFLEVALNNLVSINYLRKNTEQQYVNGTDYKGVISSYNITTTLGNGVPLQVGIRWVVGDK